MFTSAVGARTIRAQHDAASRDDRGACITHAGLVGVLVRGQAE
jgi:hypothetical protein